MNKNYKNLTFTFLNKTHNMWFEFDDEWLDIFIDDLPLIHLKGINDKTAIYVYERLCTYTSHLITKNDQFQEHADFRKKIKPIIYKIIEELNG